jgi:hypothetical protein
MNGTVECTRCHARMESGWVPDNAHVGLQRQNWCPGEPQPSFWTGLKAAEIDKFIPVTTFRCPNCGHLKSYAIPQSRNGALVSGRSSSRRQLAAVLIGLAFLLIAFGVALLFLIRAK